MNTQLLVLAGVILVAFIVLLRIFPINLWVTALFSGVNIRLIDLVLMRFRKVPPKLIVDSMILLVKGGIRNIDSNILETHYLAGGNLRNVVKALIVADKANLDLSFKNATAIDLAGRDVLEALQISVTPYMIVVPTITAVSADGIQLIAEARVTVRTNIAQLVGGAGEETITARVGQGIISVIGETRDYRKVLEAPEAISKKVLSSGLDTGTAYDILSIDIADINIGINIGARLQIDRARADLNVAKARAEKRRAMAIAHQQEMEADIEKARAILIENEALIPSALSDAFRKGQLSL